MLLLLAAVVSMAHANILSEVVKFASVLTVYTSLGAGTNDGVGEADGDTGGNIKERVGVIDGV